MSLPSAVGFVNRILAVSVRDGDVVIDATVGNGNDAVFLARLVGPEGRLFGFDVQERAVRKTRTALRKAGLSPWCRISRRGHEEMLESIPKRFHGRASAVTFNLGYLPGADGRRTTTRPASTLAGLGAAAWLVRPGGVITVVAYQGHTGGRRETDVVRAWMEGLASREYYGVSYEALNRVDDPPVAFAVVKTATG
jgi:predicted methyltransferase